MRVFLLLICIVSLIFGDKNKAKELNSEGFALYKKGALEAAYYKFSEAFELDATYAQALFNKLCTGSILYGQGRVCDMDLYMSEMGNELTTLMKLRPDWGPKVATDSDLATLRATFAFQIAIGRDPSVDSDIVQILESVNWYGPNPGAYGPLGNAYFSKGYVTFVSLNIDEGIMRQSDKPLPYKVRNGLIIVTDKKGNTITGTLSKDGILKFENLHFILSDDPDECSA